MMGSHIIWPEGMHAADDKRSYPCSRDASDVGGGEGGADQMNPDAFLALRRALQIGADQIDRGEGIEYSHEFLAEVTQAALNAMGSDERIDADVLP